MSARISVAPWARRDLHAIGIHQWTSGSPLIRWTPARWKAATAAFSLLAKARPLQASLVYVTAESVSMSAGVSTTSARVALRSLVEVGVLVSVPASGSSPALFKPRFA